MNSHKIYLEFPRFKSWDFSIDTNWNILVVKAYFYLPIHRDPTGSISRKSLKMVENRFHEKQLPWPWSVANAFIGIFTCNNVFLCSLYVKKDPFLPKMSIFPKKIEIFQFLDHNVFRWPARALNSFEMTLLSPVYLE